MNFTAQNRIIVLLPVQKWKKRLTALSSVVCWNWLILAGKCQVLTFQKCNKGIVEPLFKTKLSKFLFKITMLKTKK